MWTPPVKDESFRNNERSANPIWEYFLRHINGEIVQEVWLNSQYQRWKHWRDQRSHENEAQITSSPKFCLCELPCTLMDVLVFSDMA